MTTAYILVGIPFEERDLVREHGRAYEQYRFRVPMLWPVDRRAGKALESSAASVPAQAEGQYARPAHRLITTPEESTKRSA
jgi:hypothetical protein